MLDQQQLSDRVEILDVITAYTRAVDTANWEALRDVFTPDAVLDYTSAGGPVASLDEAIPFIRNMEGFERWQHVIGQVSVTLEGDSARATAYFINPMVARAPDGTETLWEVGGYYHHEFIRTADGWRSTRMVDELVWSR